jgi:hypothetical protein
MQRPLERFAVWLTSSGGALLDRGRPNSKLSAVEGYGARSCTCLLLPAEVASFGMFGTKRAASRVWCFEASANRLATARDPELASWPSGRPLMRSRTWQFLAIISMY